MAISSIDIHSKSEEIFANKLIIGTVNPEYLKLLIKLSNIRSMRAKWALDAYFVHGLKRKDICDKFNISQSYLCIKIKKIIKTNKLVNSSLKYLV